MALDVEMLKKMLLVLLSSNQAGEVMSASSAIARALKKDGKDIHWLAKKLVDPAPAAPPEPPPTPPPPQSGYWMDQVTFCLKHVDWITRDREYDFIMSLSDQVLSHSPSWRPSVKQLDWLEAIYVKLKRMETVYGS